MATWGGGGRMAKPGELPAKIDLDASLPADLSRLQINELRLGVGASDLLAAGAAINVATASGSRPLHEAAFVGRPSLVRLLLGHGANVQVTNARGQSPIDLARAKGNTLAALILSSSLAQTEALARRPSPASGPFDLP